jgi:anti-sigma B factor antagonist
MPLHVATQRHADVVVITVTGELDMDTAPELQEQITALLAEGGREFVFDLGEMPFCDSTGLSVFVRVKNACDELGGDVRLVRPQRSVHRILEISGLTDVLPVFDSLAEALPADSSGPDDVGAATPA